MYEGGSSVNRLIKEVPFSLCNLHSQQPIRQVKVTELNNYAIGVGDITEALRSSSANLAMTNTSLEQSVGLITASYEVLQDSGRVGRFNNPWLTINPLNCWDILRAQLTTT